MKSIAYHCGTKIVESCDVDMASDLMRVRFLVAAKLRVTPAVVQAPPLHLPNYLVLLQQFTSTQTSRQLHFLDTQPERLAHLLCSHHAIFRLLRFNCLFGPSNFAF